MQGTKSEIGIGYVIFGTSGGTALKPDMIQSWKSLHGLSDTSRNHCLRTQFAMPATNVS